MRVSIITVCYNSEQTIETTIKSVLEQTYQNLEYIIIDGNSKDRTMEIVNQYREKFDGRMKVVSEPDNGIYDAMNKGINLATGEIIGIINSDDWYENDAIEKVVKEYKIENGKYQVIYGALKIWEENKIKTICWNNVEFIGRDMIAHPSTFVTRNTYEKFGKFSMKYRICSDYDMMIRFAKKKEIKFIPLMDVLANFVIGGASSGIDCQIESNEIRYQHGYINKKTYEKVRRRLEFSKIKTKIKKTVLRK